MYQACFTNGNCMNLVYEAWGSEEKKYCKNDSFFLSFNITLDIFFIYVLKSRPSIISSPHSISLCLCLCPYPLCLCHSKIYSLDTSILSIFANSSISFSLYLFIIYFPLFISLLYSNIANISSVLLFMSICVVQYNYRHSSNIFRRDFL